MPAEYKRTERLSEQIKRDLALLIQRGLKDPRSRHGHRQLL